MRTRRAIVRSGNTSVAVMFHAWERKFALSVDGWWFAIRLETEGIQASHYFVRELNATNFNEHNKKQTNSWQEYPRKCSDSIIDSMYLVYAHQQIGKNSNNVSSARAAHFDIGIYKKYQICFFISKGVYYQISIALHLKIFAHKFENAFGNGSCLVRYRWRSVTSLKSKAAGS